jgi:hypothetical protein
MFFFLELTNNSMKESTIITHNITNIEIKYIY